MENKCLSIITNFGCHYTCPYCIVRENNLHIPRTTMEGLTNLIPTLKQHHCNKLSLSGGGDPLHMYQQNEGWYDKLFEILPSNIETELHTSYVSMPNAPYDKFDRVVYHVRSLIDLAKVKRYGQQIVRVVFVVTKDFTEEYINQIAHIVKYSSEIDELSFRQMVDNHYQTTHYCQEYLENGHQKDWWYIKQDDYNLYYCENKISYNFEDFKKEEQ